MGPYFRRRLVTAIPVFFGITILVFCMLNLAQGSILDLMGEGRGLSGNYRRLILSHILEKEHLGVLTGSGLTDVRISLVAGKSHDKHTEGGDFKDRAFDYNFAEADSMHFIRGAYHFYNPNTDPVKQADFFIDNVKLKTGDLPPVLDIEKRPKDASKLKKDLLVWLNRVERHYKVKPILYTSYKFKNKYLSDSVFNTYPYWIAHYYVDSVRYDGEWKFWQHTDAGTMPGIDEQVDLNVFNGSMSELLELTIKD